MNSVIFYRPARVCSVWGDSKDLAIDQRGMMESVKGREFLDFTYLSRFYLEIGQGAALGTRYRRSSQDPSFPCIFWSVYLLVYHCFYPPNKYNQESVYELSKR